MSLCTEFTLRLKEDFDAAIERVKFWKARSANIQSEYNERDLEFGALSRRFAAMFENGMTTEKQSEFVRMESDLQNTKRHNTEQHFKIQELEARVFELELTMGSVGSGCSNSDVLGTVELP